MLVTNYLTCDKTIRRVLVKQLRDIYRKEHNTAIIPEFSLSSTGTRADIAVVNGILHGYELKGDLDSLVRLPRQIQGYNAVFDKVTIVVGKKHVLKTIQEIPDWWGVIVAKNINSSGDPLLIEIREACQNQNQNVLTILELLWKCEIVDVLKKEGLYHKHSSSTKLELCETLINNLDTKSIKDHVRRSIVNRGKI